MGSKIVQAMDGSFIDISKVIAITDIRTTGENIDHGGGDPVRPYFYTDIVFDVHFQTPAVIASFHHGEPTKSCMTVTLASRLPYMASHVVDHEFLETFKKINKAYSDYQKFVQLWKDCVNG